MKILVVDDEQDICEILQYNLETEGYEVVTANSAEEALELPIFTPPLEGTGEVTLSISVPMPRNSRPPSPTIASASSPTFKASNSTLRV